MTLRVGFAGTPAFAAGALAAIADAGFTIPLVLTRPDKPKGRGLQVEASEVKQEAAPARDFRCSSRRRCRSPTPPPGRWRQPLDVLVVAAYGLILPRHVLDWPRHGCLNIHASRLPRWRGAAPIQRAIEAGDRATGITHHADGRGPGHRADRRRPRRRRSRRAKPQGRCTTSSRGSARRAIVDVLGRLAPRSRPRVDARSPRRARATRRRSAARRADRLGRDADAIDRQVRALRSGARARSPRWTARCSRSGAPSRSTARRASRREPSCPHADALVVACGRGALRVHRAAAGRGQAHGCACLRRRAIACARVAIRLRPRRDRSPRRRRAQSRRAADVRRPHGARCRMRIESAVHARI